MIEGTRNIRLEVRLDKDTDAQLEGLLKQPQWAEHSKSSLIRTLIRNEAERFSKLCNPPKRAMIKRRHTKGES